MLQSTPEHFGSRLSLGSTPECSRSAPGALWEQFQRALEGGTLVRCSNSSKCSRALRSTEEQSWVFVMNQTQVENFKTIMSHRWERMQHDARAVGPTLHR